MSTTTTAIPLDVSHFGWLVVLGGIACFFMAWGIGANDVANAFGTSVGAKAITLKQAVIIASIFEFIGAFTLGAAVTDTVRSGITDYDYFQDEEDLLMLGMFCALVSAGLWLFLATSLALPVSTTQAIVGGIIGFVIIEKGPDAIHWDNVYEIIIFWIATPLFGGIGAVCLFYPMRKFLLRRPYDSYQLTLKTWPFWVFLVIFVSTIFLMEKGIKNPDWDFNLGITALISFVVGIIVAIIAWLIFIKTGLVKKFVQLRTKDNDTLMSNLPDDSHSETEFTAKKSYQAHLTKYGAIRDEEDDFEGTDEADHSMMSNVLMAGLNANIFEGLNENEENIRNQSEKFDPQTEEAFAWLQVLTATFTILAHGSNDVANAVAPFAAMIGVFQSGIVSQKVEVDWWVLGIGAIAMSIGLATYGYKVIQCLGARMAAMSCTRGYCIQLSSATTIILASYFGLPASTTHALVGSTVCVGLMEVSNEQSKLTWRDVINWKLLAQTFLGWIFTLIISGLTAGGMFALLAYAPTARSVCTAQLSA